MIKINTDAAVSAKMVKRGLGIIARNWLGKLVKVRGISERKRGEANKEEALAIWSALVMAKDSGCGLT